MLITLASAVSATGQILRNLKQIEKILSEHPDQDFVLFGEAFIQGFNSLNFDSDQDRQFALDHDCEILQRLQSLAKTYNSGLGVGYLRFHNEVWTSNYLVISKQGEILLDYARMSPGWKLPEADPLVYHEGKQSGIFSYQGKQIGVLLCGEGWTNDVVSALKTQRPDFVFWPVYVCFSLPQWLQEQVEAYAVQAKNFARHVFLINNLDEPDTAYPSLGGAFYYRNGQIHDQLALNKEGCLTLQLDDES